MLTVLLCVVALLMLQPEKRFCHKELPRAALTKLDMSTVSLKDSINALVESHRDLEVKVGLIYFLRSLLRIYRSIKSQRLDVMPTYLKTVKANLNAFVVALGARCAKNYGEFYTALRPMVIQVTDLAETSMSKEDFYKDAERQLNECSKFLDEMTVTPKKYHDSVKKMLVKTIGDFKDISADTTAKLVGLQDVEAKLFETLKCLAYIDELFKSLMAPEDRAKHFETLGRVGRVFENQIAGNEATLSKTLDDGLKEIIEIFTAQQANPNDSSTKLDIDEVDAFIKKQYDIVLGQLNALETDHDTLRLKLTESPPQSYGDFCSMDAQLKFAKQMHITMRIPLARYLVRTHHKALDSPSRTTKSSAGIPAHDSASILTHEFETAFCWSAWKNDFEVHFQDSVLAAMHLRPNICFVALPSNCHKAVIEIDSEVYSCTGQWGDAVFKNLSTKEYIVMEFKKCIATKKERDICQLLRELQMTCSILGCSTVIGVLADSGTMHAIKYTKTTNEASPPTLEDVGDIAYVVQCVAESKILPCK